MRFEDGNAEEILENRRRWIFSYPMRKSGGILNTFKSRLFTQHTDNMNFINKLSILRDKWRVLVLSLTVYVVTAVILICSFPLQQSLELLFLLVYMTFACTFVPLPTPQIIMDYGGRFNPILIAIVGAIGTCMAGLID